MRVLVSGSIRSINPARQPEVIAAAKELANASPPPQQIPGQTIDAEVKKETNKT